MLDSPAHVDTNIRSMLRKAARRRRSDDRSERIWIISTDAQGYLWIYRRGLLVEL